MLIKYKSFKFTAPTLKLINTCNAIIIDWQSQGYDLTLRTLYYQLVSQDIIPNLQIEYKRLGGIINDARLAGLVDWLAIEDQTRNLETRSHWDSPADIIESVAKSYFEDLWIGQKFRPEVWIEKDALKSVIAKTCRKYDVPYFSCRGYTSQTEMWAAGQRLSDYISDGQIPIIFHLGDHDPSGIDMSRDIESRLRMFTEDSGTGIVFQFKRIALNADQIKKYNPPPNPAKLTDSRGSKYVDLHGSKSWELDALSPAVISALLVKNIETVKDNKQFEVRQAAVETSKTMLKKVSKDWNSIVKRLK